jgi:crotonobetainyl-CoA:carnitine CoA-transferase CaiB-like acyl-CoA transferase
MRPPARGEALADLRVLDCSRLIAGGVLATTLADLGADVVKAETDSIGAG